MEEDDNRYNLLDPSAVEAANAILKSCDNEVKRLQQQRIDAF